MLQQIENTDDSFSANWNWTDVCEIVTDMMQYDHGMTHFYLEHKVANVWKIYVWIKIAFYNKCFNYTRLKKVHKCDGYDFFVNYILTSKHYARSTVVIQT